MPSQDRSVFMPALARRGVSYRHFGLYQPGLGAPLGMSLSPWVVIGAIGVLALLRKIPWWLAGVGAAGAWFIMKQGPAAGTNTLTGTVTLANGQTLPLAPDARFTDHGSVLYMTVNSTLMTYPVLATDQNPTTGAWTITAADNGTAAPLLP